MSDKISFNEIVKKTSLQKKRFFTILLLLKKFHSDKEISKKYIDIVFNKFQLQYTAEEIKYYDKINKFYNTFSIG